MHAFRPSLRRVLLPQGAAADALGLVPAALRRAPADPQGPLKRPSARREEMDGDRSPPASGVAYESVKKRPLAQGEMKT